MNQALIMQLQNRAQQTAAARLRTHPVYERPRRGGGQNVDAIWWYDKNTDDQFDLDNAARFNDVEGNPVTVWADLPSDSEHVYGLRAGCFWFSPYVPEVVDGELIEKRYQICVPVEIS